jgi:hypothetical protein
MARAGRSDGGRARCLRSACRCADVSGRDLSGERQLARTQQQKQKRRQETTGWEGRPVGVRGDETWERRVCRIVDEVGVIGEVRSRVVRAGGGIIKEKSLGLAVRGVERMGLWGTGGRVGATQETHAAVHAGRRQSRGRAHFTCGSLS